MTRPPWFPQNSEEEARWEAQAFKKPPSPWRVALFYAVLIALIGGLVWWWVK